MRGTRDLTIIVMSSEIGLADNEIVISIQFPELAVDDVKVFIREVLRNQVDVLFSLQGGEDVEEIGAA